MCHPNQTAPPVGGRESRFARSDQIINGDIVFCESVLLADWIIGHPCHFQHLETRVADPLCQLRGFDQFGVLVGAARKQIQHIFGADDCKQKRLGITVNG